MRDHSRIGGIAGYIDSGAIEDCYSNVQYTIVAPYPSRVGGLISTVQSFYGHTAVDNCYATGNVTGDGEMGGLYGYAEAINNLLTLADSFSTITMSSNMVTQGGAVGYLFNNSNALIFNGIHFDVTRSNTSNCAGASFGSAATIDCRPQNEANADPTYFENSSTNPPFNGWYFDTIWQVTAGYPELIHDSPSIAPDPPTDLAVLTNGTTADLSWTAPVNDGGSPIIDYTIQYKLQSASTWDELSHAPDPATTQTITGLLSGEVYDFRIAAVNAIGSSTWLEANTLSVTTFGASSITATTVSLTGEITDTGFSPIISKGFEYGLTSSYGSQVSESNGSVGLYTIPASSLTEATIYHYRAFITNDQGTAYGEDKVFRTASVPYVGTLPLESAATRTTATLSGETSTQGITERGFQLGTTTSYGSTQTDTSSLTYRRTLNSWPISGNINGLGAFDVEFGPDNNLYVAHTQDGRIQRYDREGQYLANWGSQGTQPADLNEPWSIAVLDESNFYVANTSNSNVLRVHVNNDNGYSIQPLGTFGSAPGEFEGPSGIALDGNGDLYVSDDGNDRVQKIDLNGTPLLQWGSPGSGPGQFNGPRGIAVDPNGYIYVSDQNNNRVQKFTTTGTYVSSISSLGDEGGSLNAPVDIEISVTGNIYISDFGNTRVVKLDPAGNYITSYTLYQTGGLTVDSRDDIYVINATDSGAPQVSQLTGSIEKEVSGLTCGTTYHYRAYATSVAGTVYGDDMTFTTAACAITPTPPTPTPTPTPSPSPTTPTPTPTPSPSPTTPTPTPTPGASPTSPIPRTRTPSRTPNGSTQNNSTNGPLPTEKERTLGFRIGELSTSATRSLAKTPQSVVESFPILLIIILLTLALLYAQQSYRYYKTRQATAASIEQHRKTLLALENYLSITSHYLNTPASILKNGMELMTSLKELSSTAAKKLSAQIDKLSLDIKKIITEAQAMALSIEEDEPIVGEDLKEDTSSVKRIGIPIAITAGALLIVDLLFAKAGKIDLDLLRLGLQLSIYCVSAMLLALSYRTRVAQKNASLSAEKALKAQKLLMKQRNDFITSALRTLASSTSEIQAGSDSVIKLPHGGSYMKGLDMLGALTASLTNAKIFADIKSTTQQKLDISTAIQKIVDSNATKLMEKSITVNQQLTQPLSTNISQEEFEQLFGSILENAIKFSHENSTITVIGKREPAGLSIKVTDSGEGIDKTRLSELFQPFSRATSTETYDYEGLGLSLYVDKIIIEKAGGSIKITSTRNKGTTVLITLP